MQDHKIERSVIEFRCPECGGGVPDRHLKKELQCLDCAKMWKHPKESFRAFVLVRRFISKLDYDHYCELKARKTSIG